MEKLLASLIIFLLGTIPVMAYEYPTEETVRYALNCMDELGGQNDQNLYTCACRYDHIKTAISFHEYGDAVTYERNKAMAGKKGGFFRANKRAIKIHERLEDIRETADSNCIVVKHVERTNNK
ncbi:MAG: hypothetical protein O7D86_01485 [Proteobacteria bacterium]|nr:hypothetical protein [Pseudomonadota bacterium]